MKITFELNGIEGLGALRDWLNSLNTNEKQPSARVGTSLSGLYLGVRNSNFLRSENILTIENLVTWSQLDLLKKPNIGRKSVKEIEDALGRLGFKLADRHKGTRETTPPT